MIALIAWWSRLPRAARWGVLALLGVAAYFGIAEPVIDATVSLNQRADKRIAELRTFEKQRQARKDADAAAALGVSRFGVVEGPGGPSERSEAFNKAMNTMIEAHGIRSPVITTKELPLGTTGPLTTTVGADERVERLVNEISFEGTPEQLARVVADLERTPEVAVVSRVQARPAGGDKPGRVLRATVVAEAWQVKKKGRTK